LSAINIADPISGALSPMVFASGWSINTAGRSVMLTLKYSMDPVPQGDIKQPNWGMVTAPPAGTAVDYFPTATFGQSNPGYFNALFLVGRRSQPCSGQGTPGCGDSFFATKYLELIP
jgi:hypothetical protein